MNFSWPAIAVLVSLRRAGRTPRSIAAAIGLAPYAHVAAELLTSLQEQGLIDLRSGGRMHATWHLTRAGVVELERQGLQVTDPLILEK